MTELRPYQSDCLDTIITNYQDGLRKMAIALPTGAGKTVIFAELIRRALSAKPTMKSLIIAHREELLTQAAHKVVAAIPTVRLSIEQAHKRADQSASVVIASIQTLSREKRLAKFDPNLFDVIVVDECHHAIARSYRKVLDHFNSSGNRFVLGFTATLFRKGKGQTKALHDLFDYIAYRLDIHDLVGMGFLAPIKAWQVKTDHFIGNVKVVRGDFSDSELAAAIDTPERNRLIVDSYLDKTPNQKALVFCVNVAHAIHVYQEFMEAGVLAAYVVGETPSQERTEILKRFAEGEIQVLVNCMVLTEGFDEPSITAIHMARPTKSQGLYCQAVGRGTRIHPGKEFLTVVDYTDNSTKHRLETVRAAELYKLRAPDPESAAVMGWEDVPVQMPATRDPEGVTIESVSYEPLDILARARHNAAKGGDSRPFWADDGATDSQLRFLRALGMGKAIKDVALTKGEAALMIDEGQKRPATPAMIHKCAWLKLGLPDGVDRYADLKWMQARSMIAGHYAPGIMRERERRQYEQHH